MGHYYFIYNNNFQEEESENDSTLVEWKYELPPMFYPLFVAKPEYFDSFLYCNAKEGFAAFTKMYDFLEKYRDKIFENPDEFLEYKPKILEYIQPNATHYQLDGSDVFLMSIEDDDEAILQEHQAVYEIKKIPIIKFLML